MSLKQKITSKLPYILSCSAAASMAYLLSQKYQRKQMEGLPAFNEMVAIVRRDERVRKMLGDAVFASFRLKDLPQIGLKRSAERMEIAFIAEGRRSRKNVTAILTSKTLGEIERSDDPAALRAQFCLPDAEVDTQAVALPASSRFWKLEALHIYEPDGRRRIVLPAPPPAPPRLSGRDVVQEAQQRLSVYNQGLSPDALRLEDEQIRVRSLNLERTSRIFYTAFYVGLSLLNVLVYLKANQKRSIANTELFSQGVKYVMEQLDTKSEVIFNKTSIGYMVKDRAHFALQFANRDLTGAAEFDSQREGARWHIVRGELHVTPVEAPPSSPVRR